jgi:hypothetical protein
MSLGSLERAPSPAAVGYVYVFQGAPPERLPAAARDTRVALATGFAPIVVNRCI